MEISYDVPYEMSKNLFSPELNEFIKNFKAYNENKKCSIQIQNLSSFKSLKLKVSSLVLFRILPKK